MIRTTVRVLNLLVQRRPRYMLALSVGGQLDLSISTVRGALQELVRRGLVEFTDDPPKFDGEAPSRTYRATAHAVPVDPDALPRRGPVPGDQRERTLEILRGMGAPATLRDVMKATGLAETGAAKHLKALLEEGRVSRIPGPPPPTGSSRPWLWQAVEIEMNAAC